ncbi:hypothetical protein [Gemmatimonas sp.]
MSPTVVIALKFGQSADQAAANAARAAQNADQAARNADQARANADRIIENAIQDAERAVNGGTPAAAPVPPVPPQPGQGPVVFTNDGDRPVSISFDNGSFILTQDGNTQVIPLREAIPREAAQIAWAIPATLSVLLIWWPISRAVIRWLNRKNVANGETAALEARLRDRLDLLERNVDTVAVEMERLSEGQRFTNKLLADRAEQGERVPLNVPR